MRTLLIDEYAHQYIVNMDNLESIQTDFDGSIPENKRVRIRVASLLDVYIIYLDVQNDMDAAEGKELTAHIRKRINDYILSDTCKSLNINSKVTEIIEAWKTLMSEEKKVDENNNRTD